MQSDVSVSAKHEMVTVYRSKKDWFITKNHMLVTRRERKKIASSLSIGFLGKVRVKHPSRVPARRKTIALNAPSRLVVYEAKRS